MRNYYKFWFQVKKHVAEYLKTWKFIWIIVSTLVENVGKKELENT